MLLQHSRNLIKKKLKNIINIPKSIFVNLYAKKLGGTKTVAKKVNTFKFKVKTSKFNS